MMVAINSLSTQRGSVLGLQPDALGTRGRALGAGRLTTITLDLLASVKKHNE